MAGFNEKSQYRRWIEPAKPSSLYPFAYNFVLIKSIEELKQVLNQNFDVIAFDTETTGLNLDEAYLVGYSFCFDDKTAYYVPVDHAEYFEVTKEMEISKDTYENALKNEIPQGINYVIKDDKYFYQEGYIVKPGLGKESVDIFYERILKCRYVFMFNARFDMRVFEKYGFVQDKVDYDTRYSKLFNYYDMSKVNFMDVQVLVFLVDTNVPYPSLKKSEEYYLGWRGASFEETLGDVENFYYLKPEEAYIYAATDALGTFLLAEKLWQFYTEPEQHTQGPYTSSFLDNKFLYPLLLMEEELVYIDVPLLQDYSKHYEEEINAIQEEAFRINGQPFNMGSPKQKSEAFNKLNIITYEADGSRAVNKRGEIKGDKKHLEAAMNSYEENDIRRTFIKDILQFATLNKQKGTYTDNFIEMCKKSKYGNRLRFSYKTMVVPSGRLAAGGDKKNSYFADANIQNITKPTMTEVYYIHKSSLKELGIDEKEYDNPRQEYFLNGEKTYMILNWVFKESPWNLKYTSDKPNQFVIEGFRQHRNIRSAFTPDDDKYWVSCDFSAQELRVPALLSREPLWTTTFASGGDLHKEMAIRMWGKENYDKKKRKMAKSANFGILYGMTAKNFAEGFNMPYEEAVELVEKYKASAPVLFRWVHNNEDFIKANGVGYTLCGRPRRLRYYLESTDRGLYNFGIRSCTNTVIQGSGADILKISFLNIYNQFFLPKVRETNRKYIKFLNTVHDEINFNISKKHIYKIVPKVISCMRLWWPDWEFPMQVGLDIGTRWGMTIPFKYDGRPYVKIDEQPLKPNEKRYIYYDYETLPLEQGQARNIVGLKRYVENPNGNYVKNDKYLQIIEPDGSPFDPSTIHHEETKEEINEVNEIEELINSQMEV